MSDDDSKSRLRAVPKHVDHVVRKERFLAEHPEVVIDCDPKASPYEQWRGQVPGHEQVFSCELGHLLNRLEELIATDEAEQRWPGES